MIFYRNEAIGVISGLGCEWRYMILASRKENPFWGKISVLGSIWVLFGTNLFIVVKPEARPQHNMSLYCED